MIENVYPAGQKGDLKDEESAGKSVRQGHGMRMNLADSKNNKQWDEAGAE